MEQKFKKFVNKEKGIVTVVLEDCKNDAWNTIQKRTTLFDCSGDEYFYASMPDRFVGVAKCIGDDVFNEEKGFEIASKKAMAKHKKAHTAAIKRWQDYMLKRIANVNQDTFKELKKCDCKCHK